MQLCPGGQTTPSQVSSQTMRQRLSDWQVPPAAMHSAPHGTASGLDASAIVASTASPESITAPSMMSPSVPDLSKKQPAHTTNTHATATARMPNRIPVKPGAC